MVVITATKQISEDCVKLTLSTGSCFFIRLHYLSFVTPAQIVPEKELSEEELNDVINAGSAFAAEQAANSYLERSEHTRFLLSKKLLAKKFDSAAINQALDYLEEKSYLSDSRFAEAWLRNRAINHLEGSARLLTELYARGVSRKIAEQAVSEHFSALDESELLKKTAAKCLRLGKTGLVAEKYLLRKGFSKTQIKQIISLL